MTSDENETKILNFYLKKNKAVLRVLAMEKEQRFVFSYSEQTNELKKILFRFKSALEKATDSTVDFQTLNEWLDRVVLYKEEDERYTLKKLVWREANEEIRKKHDIDQHNEKMRRNQ